MSVWIGSKGLCVRGLVYSVAMLRGGGIFRNRTLVRALRLLKVLPLEDLS